MMSALTRRQVDCLSFIRGFREREGVPPTYDEIKAGIGLRSKSGIHRLVKGLEARGALRSADYARSIQIVESQSLEDVLGPQLFKALNEACAKLNMSTKTGLRVIVSNWLGVG